MSKTQIWVAGVFIIYFVAFFNFPLFPYAASVSIPYAYRDGYSACVPGGYIDPNATLTPQEEECLAGYALPPAATTSYATAGYRAFGYGQAPFQDVSTVSSGNYSAVLFFGGDRLLAAEKFDSPTVEVNPVSVVAFLKAPVSSSDFGLINITVEIRNVGDLSIQHPTIFLSMAGYSTNSTVGGVTWIQPRVVGGCQPVLAPGEYCTVTQVARNLLPANKSFNYYAEVRGFHDGSYFVYRQGFGEAYPQGGVGPIWVARFIGLVNNNRTASQLSENATLDSFAALRFKDASANFSISDYGFGADATSFFGGSENGPYIEELLLYPGVYSPSAYVSFLSTYAPKHWGGLTDPAFTQYGYYVSTAPYYQVNLQCPVYEIPGPNINITQYFHSHGCRTMVDPFVTWLVIILSS